MAGSNDVLIHRTVSDPGPNWSELVAKTTDDLARIARTEIELLEVSLKRVLEAQGEKLAGILILVTALAYGLFFLLSGIVLLIHVWLAWWIAFLITAGFVVTLGVIGQFALSAAARRTSA